MNRTKYVMFDDFNPILFHEGLTHEHIANIFQYTYHEPTSAGFVQLSIESVVGNLIEGLPYLPYLSYKESHKIKVHVYGESVSLKLKSKPEDADTIRRMFGLED